jgi:hypothetical protein
LFADYPGHHPAEMAGVAALESKESAPLSQPYQLGD